MTGKQDVGSATLTVRIPGLLRSYTKGASNVTVSRVHGMTLDDALRELDRQFPGLRFRIVDEQQRVRPHIKIFVDTMLARELGVAVEEARELMVVGALSGG